MPPFLRLHVSLFPLESSTIFYRPAAGAGTPDNCPLNLAQVTPDSTIPFAHRTNRYRTAVEYGTGAEAMAAKARVRSIRQLAAIRAAMRKLASSDHRELTACEPLLQYAVPSTVVCHTNDPKCLNLFSDRIAVVQQILGSYSLLNVSMSNAL